MSRRVFHGLLASLLLVNLSLGAFWLLKHRSVASSAATSAAPAAVSCPVGGAQQVASARPPASGPPPAPGAPGAPKAGPDWDDPNAPYKVVRSYEYWAFSPDHVDYAFHGELMATKAGRIAIGPIRNPCYPEVKPTNVRIGKTATLARWDPQPHPQGYSTVAPVLLPSAPLGVKDLLALDAAWVEKRVPYLHDEGGGQHRLLSLSGRDLDPKRDTRLFFAIPTSATGITLSDLRPVRERTMGAWRVYDYHGAGQDHFTIHLGFDFAAAPPDRAPAPEEVFQGSPASLKNYPL